MKNSKISELYFILLFLFLRSSSLVAHSFTYGFDESLDAVLHDHAFKEMIHRRPHTGALYNANLPPNLAGMKVSVVGLRSRSLWRKGANFSDFIIPPRTLPTPYVKRLLIVYHNLGNWSSFYYNLRGYSFVTPVVGFLAYDASGLSGKNLSKLEFNTMGKPISIVFGNLRGVNRKRMKCVAFGSYGEVYLSEIGFPNVCYSTSEGHFSVMVPLKEKRRSWPFWVVGMVGMMVVGLGGVVAVRSLLGKRVEEMEKEADDGECLETYWISTSKMPRAEVTRTQPVLESTTLPNPKLSWYASN